MGSSTIDLVWERPDPSGQFVLGRSAFFDNYNVYNGGMIDVVDTAPLNLKTAKGSPSSATYCKTGSVAQLTNPNYEYAIACPTAPPTGSVLLFKNGKVVGSLVSGVPTPQFSNVGVVEEPTGFIVVMTSLTMTTTDIVFEVFDPALAPKCKLSAPLYNSLVVIMDDFMAGVRNTGEVDILRISLCAIVIPNIWPAQPDSVLVALHPSGYFLVGDRTLGVGGGFVFVTLNPGPSASTTPYTAPTSVKMGAKTDTRVVFFNDYSFIICAPKSSFLGVFPPLGSVPTVIAPFLPNIGEFSFIIINMERECNG